MGARWQMLPGSHLVEPPTSTMSRPIGRTKTRVDTLKLTVNIFGIKFLSWRMRGVLLTELQFCRVNLGESTFPGGAAPHS